MSARWSVSRATAVREDHSCSPDVKGLKGKGAVLADLYASFVLGSGFLLLVEWTRRESSSSLRVRNGGSATRLAVGFPEDSAVEPLI